MTLENVELARQGYEAFRTGRLEAVLEMMDPDIEWSEGVDVPEPQVYRGHDGVRRQQEQFEAAWESFELEAEEFIDAGDKVVVLLKIRARGRGSEIEIEGRAAHVWTVRDGKAIRLEMYIDPARALEAAGVPRESPTTPD
jgi:hypothetical protein